jgi:hemerythrin-like domain-containing protein
MKRSSELTSLSHDHHQALFVAMQLKRAEDTSVARIFLEFMDQHGEQHFQAEEQILLPGWIASDPNADPAMAIRVQTEHLEIRASARALRAGQCAVDELQQLGELLERHVRFEERELFPLIEGGLGEGSLTALGSELANAESD